jgi:NRPS condensation-like uncharacterized protein
LTNKKWYKLDNAGKLYPSIVSTRRSTVFRLTVKMKKPVDAAILQQALEDTIKRFPYYKVNLKRGLFWYYFEESEHSPVVEKETYYPCMFLKFKTKKTFPIRVLYYNQFIHLEISHSIADGTSGMIFLKTLVGQYLRLKENIEFVEGSGVMAVRGEISELEWEDAFKKYYKKGIPKPNKLPKSVHFPFELTEKGRYDLLTGIVPLLPVKQLAKAYECTVTIFITALYFMAIEDYIEGLNPDQKKKMIGKIVINLPVDIRQLFPSLTMRNFFISFTPSIDLRLGHYELKEVIEYLKSYMKLHYNTKFISQYITRNVKNEKLLLVRLLPLWIKNIVMPYVYNHFGERGYTSSVSNLGIIKLPEELNDYIENFEFYPAPSETNKIKMCMCAYQDKINISFGKTTENTEIEKYFFRRLRKMGIPIKIETNTHHQ